MKTLIYTCADKEYAHWIPMYCLGMIMYNDNVDIEVGLKLAREYLKKKFR